MYKKKKKFKKIKNKKEAYKIFPTQGNINKPTGSSSVSIDEAYKLLGLKRGCTKEEVLNAAKKLQQKIHPDMNRDVKTERLSQLVNEAVDKIIKSDFV